MTENVTNAIANLIIKLSLILFIYPMFTIGAFYLFNLIFNVAIIGYFQALLVNFILNLTYTSLKFIKSKCSKQ